MLGTFTYLCYTLMKSFTKKGHKGRSLINKQSISFYQAKKKNVVDSRTMVFIIYSYFAQEVWGENL